MDVVKTEAVLLRHNPEMDIKIEPTLKVFDTNSTDYGLGMSIEKTRVQDCAWLELPAETPKHQKA